MEEKKIGPLITDSEFFAELDCAVPALREACRLMENGERTAAYCVFREHIRSLIDKDKFYSLSGRTRTPQFSEKLKENAERAMNHLMISCDVPFQYGEKIIWDFNPTPNKYKEWRWQLSRHPEALSLSRAYRATGEEKYIKEALSMLVSWIEQAPREDYKINPYDDTLWRTIECGIRMRAWVEIIYSAAESEKFTPEICVTIFKSVFEHNMRLTSAYTHGNWLMMEMSGVSLSNLFFPIFKKSAEWCDGVVDMLTRSICHQIYPDGAQYELAPSYQWVVLDNARSIEEAFAIMGRKFPEEYYLAYNSSFEYFLRLNMANGMVPPVNDSPASGAAGLISHFLGGLYTCSDEARWLATGGNEGVKPAFNSAILPYAGFVTLRSGWEKGDVTAFFDGGKFGRDHFHEDKLNFLIYDSEGPLLYEMGTYAYDNSPYRDFAKKSQGHNVILVDGCGQNRLFTKDWREESYTHDKEPLLFYEDSELVFASAEYTDHYGYEDYDGKAPFKPAKHRRSVIMLKADEPRDTVYLVLDELISLDGEEHTYDALWHMNTDGFTDGELCASSERISFITSGFESMICETGITEGAKPRGIISPTSVQNKFYPAPQYTVTAKGKDAELATVFMHRSLDKSEISSVDFKGGVAKLMKKSGEALEFNLAELIERARKSAC